MEWNSFILGIITVTMGYALIMDNRETEDETEDIEDETEEESGIIINSGRHVTLSCQTCRKLKRHKEVETNLYQCTKCKRHIDLRRAS